MEDSQTSPQPPVIPPKVSADTEEEEKSEMKAAGVLGLFFLTLWIAIAFAVNPEEKKPYRIFDRQDSQNILFSQTSLSGQTSERGGNKKILLTDLSNDMKTNGFKKEFPVEVVEMRKDTFTSLDNRRLAAAQKAEVKIPAIVHQPEDKLPVNQQSRFGNSQTYGAAVNQRMRSGSFDEKSIPNVPGYPANKVRIRTNGLQPSDKNDIAATFGDRFVVSDKRRSDPYKPLDGFKPSVSNIQENKPITMSKESWPTLGEKKPSSSSPGQSGTLNTETGSSSTGTNARGSLFSNKPAGSGNAVNPSQTGNSYASASSRGSLTYAGSVGATGLGGQSSSTFNARSGGTTGLGGQSSSTFNARSGGTTGLGGQSSSTFNARSGGTTGLGGQSSSTFNTRPGGTSGTNIGRGASSSTSSIGRGGKSTSNGGRGLKPMGGRGKG